MNFLLNKKETSQPRLSITSSSTSSSEKSAFNKVLFYYPDFGAMGGIERFIRLVAASFKSRKTIKPIIVCTKGTPFYNTLKKEGFKEGVDLWGIQTHSIFKRPHLRIFDLASFIQLAFILKNVQPNIIHVHIGQIENLFFKILGFPVVYSFHGYGSLYSLKEVSGQVKQIFKKILRFFFHKMASQIDTIIFVSQSEQRRMTDEGFLSKKAKRLVIYNGSPIQSIQKSIININKNEIKAHLNIPIKSRIVSFINRMDQNKNPLEFIKLAEELIKSDNNLYFLMAGTGPLDAWVKEVISKSPNKKHFRFIGHQKEIYPLIALSNLIVHTPTSEGFGLGILEAMSLGTPCLAYSVGGIPEVLNVPNSELFLADARNFNQLREKAIHLLSLNPIKLKKISKMLQTHSERFDLLNTVSQLEKVYADVIRK